MQEGAYTPGSEVPPSHCQTSRIDSIPPYRVTSLIRHRPPPGPFRRPMRKGPMVFLGGRWYRMSEVTL